MNLLNQIKYLSFFILSSLCIVFSQVDIEEGIIYYDNKDYKSAITFFENYIKLNSESEVAYSYLANSYLSLELYIEALRILEKAIKHFPQNHEFLLKLSQLYINQKKYNEAEKLLEKCLKIKPEDFETRKSLSILYYNSGVALVNKKRYSEALEQFNKSVKYDSTNENAYTSILTIHLEKKNYPEAEKVAKIGISKFPKSDLFPQLLFEIYINSGKFNEAEVLLEQLYQVQKYDVELGLKLAMLYRINNKIAKALALYDSLIVKNLRNRKVYQSLIDYWKLFSNQEKIREVYEKMSKYFPDDDQILMDIAKTYEIEKKYEEARQAYRKVLTINSINVDAFLAIAKTYKIEASDSLALNYLDRVLEIDVQNFEALRMKGEIYSSLKLHSEAIKVFKQLHNYYENLSYPLFKIGKEYLKLNKSDSAKYYFYNAINNEKNSPLPYFELASIFKEENKKDSSIKYLRQSLKYGIKKLESLQLKIKAEFTEKTGEFQIEKLEKNTELYNELSDLEKLISQIFETLKLLQTRSEFEKLLNDYLKDYPNSIFLLLYQGELFENTNRIELATGIYQKIISINPNILKAHEKLAVIYEGKKEFEKADLAYRRVLSIDEFNENAYDGLIRIHKNKGTLENLCDEWEKLYKMKPHNKVLRERLIEVFHKANKNEKVREVLENENKN